MDIKNKKILVTGGTGLVGKHTVKLLLDAGAYVICFTRNEIKSTHKNLQYIVCDLKDLNNLKKKNKQPKVDAVDYLVYIAASIPQLHEKKETLLEAKENTLDPFLYVMDLYGQDVQKTLYTSTIDIYGYPCVENFDENTTIDPLTPYAIAKYAGEQYLKMYTKLSNRSYTILRFSQIYGENEPFVRIIPFAIDAAIHNKPFTLWGNPQNKRKFLYAGDAAKAIIAGLMYKTNAVFQIAGPEEVTIQQIVSTIEQITGKQIIIERKNEDSPETHITPSTELAKNKLGFVAETTITDGLTKVIKSYEHI